MTVLVISTTVARISPHLTGSSQSSSCSCALCSELRRHKSHCPLGLDKYDLQTSASPFSFMAALPLHASANHAAPPQWKLYMYGGEAVHYVLSMGGENDTYAFEYMHIDAERIRIQANPLLRR